MTGIAVTRHNICHRCKNSLSSDNTNPSDYYRALRSSRQPIRFAAAQQRSVVLRLYETNKRFRSRLWSALLYRREKPFLPIINCSLICVPTNICSCLLFRNKTLNIPNQRGARPAAGTSSQPSVVTTGPQVLWRQVILAKKSTYWDRLAFHQAFKDKNIIN